MSENEPFLWNNLIIEIIYFLLEQLPFSVIYTNFMWFTLIELPVTRYLVFLYVYNNIYCVNNWTINKSI